mgnify:CR=1 FL=1
MKKLGGKRKMRNKKLWKNLMLVTTLTVALGTVSATALAEDDVTLAGGTQVTAFASEGDIDGGIAVETQAEQTAPEADVTDAEATAPEAEQTEQTAPEAEVAPQADTTDAEAIAPEAEQTTPEATAPEVEQTAPEATVPEQTAPEAIVPEQTAPEATAPEADTTVKDEVSAPEVKAVTVDVTASSQTFDGTQDIVITYTVNGVQDGFEPYQDIPWFDGKTGVKEEKVSSTVYKFTIPTTLQQYVIEQNGATDGQTFVFDSKYSTGAVDFPTVTLTYTTGDNGDNGNGETPEKPENPDPDNGNGETPEKPENPDPEKPENPDNGNGDNQKPENPDNGGDNGDNQNPDGDNNQTPETPDNGDDNKDVQDWMTLTPAQKVTTTTQTQTPQTQTVSTTQTAPKTGDAASTLPLLGTGLTSLGVALGAIFKKRR